MNAPHTIARAGTIAAAIIALCGLEARWLGGQTPAPPPPTPASAWAHVSYISGTTIYLDAGSRDGLRQGSRLTVMRDTVVVAQLAVEYISSSSAASQVVGTAAQPVAVGDSARYTPAAPTAAEAAASSALAGDRATPVRSRYQPNALRGRVGLRYMVVDPGTGPAGVLTQPAFDVRLDGAHLSNSPVGLSVDVRAQRSILPAPDSAHPAPTYPLNVTRVYKAAVQWNPMGRPATLTLGRQYSQTSSSVGLFDGLALDYVRAHWSTGVFGGFVPSVMTFGFSDSTREYGTYVQWHNVTAQLPIWSLTVGGVGAYTMGQIDREFTYVSAMYAGARVSAYVTQELDINRGWRATMEHSAATPTSTFGTVQVAVTDAVSVYGGIDNRRNVRLYRDYLTPEAAFDDSFRQGEWAGASLNLHGRFRMSGDTRTTSGGPAGVATSYTGSMGVMRLTPLQLGFRARATRYSGQLSTGQLQSLSAEVYPFDLFHVEATAGTRTSTPTVAGLVMGASHVTWSSVDADWGLGRSVYLMFSIYREQGAGIHNAQSFMSISYRF